MWYDRCVLHLILRFHGNGSMSYLYARHFYVRQAHSPLRTDVAMAAERRWLTDEWTHVMWAESGQIQLNLLYYNFINWPGLVVIRFISNCKDKVAVRFWFQVFKLTVFLIVNSKIFNYVIVFVPTTIQKNKYLFIRTAVY